MESIFILIEVLIVGWLCVLSYYCYRIILRFRKLTDGIKHENPAAILDRFLRDIEANTKDIDRLRKEIDGIIRKDVYHIQKIGVLRFNPFADTGGDQSFVLAILDDRKTGVVLTSLHNRGITRWYAKNVKEGKGVDHELSDEEIRAIEMAVHQKIQPEHNKL